MRISISQCRTALVFGVFLGMIGGCGLFSSEPEYYGYEEEFIIPEPDMIPSMPDDNPGRTVDQMLEMKPRPVHEVRPVIGEEVSDSEPVEKKESEPAYEHEGRFGSKEKISLRKGLNAPAADMVYGTRKREEATVVRPLELKKAALNPAVSGRDEEEILSGIVAAGDETAAQKDENSARMTSDETSEKKETPPEPEMAAAKTDAVPVPEKVKSAEKESVSGVEMIEVVPLKEKAVASETVRTVEMIEVVPAAGTAAEAEGAAEEEIPAEQIEIVPPASAAVKKVAAVPPLRASDPKPAASRAAPVKMVELEPVASVSLKPLSSEPAEPGFRLVPPSAEEDGPVHLLAPSAEVKNEPASFDSLLVDAKPQTFTLKPPVLSLTDGETVAAEEDESLALIAPSPMEDPNDSDINISQNVATITFPMGKTAFPYRAKGEVAAAVSALKAQSFGRLAVVGYDAPKNGKGSRAKAMERANAVADVLYRAGVPGRKVKVSAQVGAPYGEKYGNHVEIYLEYE